MIKIIGGKFKNRLIPTAKSIEYRPTTAKLKEAIFSILTSGNFTNENILNNDAEVLDLFAGSGALGFEALSRGAKSITFIDINYENINLGKIFSKTIGEEKNVNFLNLDALNLPQAFKSFSLIFIDPPYGQNLVTKAIDILVKKGWAGTNSILVIEIPKTLTITYSENVKELVNRKYGKSKLLILKIL